MESNHQRFNHFFQSTVVVEFTKTANFSSKFCYFSCFSIIHRNWKLAGPGRQGNRCSSCMADGCRSFRQMIRESRIAAVKNPSILPEFIVYHTGVYCGINYFPLPPFALSKSSWVQTSRRAKTFHSQSYF